jgi:hypothetical protein
VEYSLGLSANQQQARPAKGAYLLFTDLGAASSVVVEMRAGNVLLEKFTAAKGDKARVEAGLQFDTLVFTSTVDTAIKFVVSNGLVDINLIEGATVTVGNSIANPVAVSAVDLPAAAITDGAAGVNINDGGGVAQLIVAADVNRRALRFANIGTDAVALGGVNVKWAGRVIVLYPGDTFVEDRAANLAWYGVTAAGTTAVVTTQEVNV